MIILYRGCGGVATGNQISVFVAQLIGYHRRTAEVVRIPPTIRVFPGLFLTDIHQR